MRGCSPRLSNRCRMFERREHQCLSDILGDEMVSQRMTLRLKVTGTQNLSIETTELRVLHGLLDLNSFRTHRRGHVILFVP